MNSAIPFIISLVSFFFVAIGLRELIKELKISYKRKLA
tara:strand:+ start:379 stop:492 length:114 start_codon:yes stop_codon:yes gene_type:complete